MKSAIHAEIAALQRELHRLRQDYESAILNEVQFDDLKIIRQAIKEKEEELTVLLAEADCELGTSKKSR